MFMKNVLFFVDSLDLQMPSVCPITSQSSKNWTVGGAYGKLSVRDLSDGRARLTYESLVKYLVSTPGLVRKC